jgi:hypothetical protein
VFKRLFRVVFRLALIAAIGYGIAVAVKKLTAPADGPLPIEPWPPLAPEPTAPTSTNP